VVSDTGELTKKTNSQSLGGASALLDAVAAISAQLEVRAVAQEAAKQIVQFTNTDACAISKWDVDMGIVVLWAEYKRGQNITSPVPYLPYKISEYPTTERVLNSSVPAQIHADDPKADKGERLMMEGMKAKSMLMLPLFAQERTIGLIEIFEIKRSRVFKQEEITTVQVLANHAGISLDRADLLAETKQRASELEAIRQASLSLTASLEQEDVFKAIMESALRLSHDSMDAHIFIYQDKILTFGAALWAEGIKGEIYTETREDGLTYTVARSGEVVTVEEVTQHSLFKDTDWLKSEWKGSIVGLPLKIGTRVVGVMNIAYRKPQEFTKDKLRILGLLADQAALTIVNARLHKMVSKQARTDPLTGLANRRAFDERLDEEIRRSSRYKHPFVIFMMDLDGFKRINDTYGHPTGDKTLRMLGKCFLETVRDTDFVARFGGDEFVMVFPETEKAYAKKVAKKLVQAVNDYPFPWKSEKIPLTLSITVGVACYPSDGENAEDLIAAADVALYKVKEGKLKLDN